VTADPTATISSPGFETLIVCLHCHGETRTWRPETLQAFRAWHRQRCGGGSNGSTDPQVKGVEWVAQSGPARRESPGPWPETYEGGRA
jgi:hypothetical protein